MATITVTSDDPNVIQDVENFLTSLYQRGLPVEHTSTESKVSTEIEEHEVIATGKTSDFPDDPKAKK